MPLGLMSATNISFTSMITSFFLKTMPRLFLRFPANKCIGKSSIFSMPLLGFFTRCSAAKRINTFKIYPLEKKSR